MSRIHLMIFSAALGLAACERPADNTAKADPIPTADRALLDLARSAISRQPSQPDDVAVDIRFPQDLHPHPDARAESYSIDAVFADTGTTMSVQAQFERVKLRLSPSEHSNKSHWSFNSVMRAQITTAQTGDDVPSTHESVQRQALGLANSHDNGLFVGVQQLHTTVSAAQLVATPEARLNNQTRQPINGTVRVQQARTAPTCDNNFQLDVLSANNDSLVLDWQAGNCPTVNQLANANQWSLGPVPVRLQMQPHPSAGTPSSKVRVGWVWVSHAWGGIPNQGAVVLDQLRLILDTQTNQPFSISANRSKRRSGRGPKQVLATIRGRDWQDQSLDMQWIDEGPLVPPSSGVTYPDQFRLLNESRGLNVLLTPLVSPPNINGSSAPRWNGAVVVSGSHQGVGFVSFEPVGRSLPSIDVVSNK